MKRFIFEPESDAVNSSPSDKVEALFQWAKQLEVSLEKMNANNMLLIVGFDALVGLLIEKGIITDEELLLAREAKLDILSKLQGKKSDIVVPRSGIITPPSS